MGPSSNGEKVRNFSEGLFHFGTSIIKMVYVEGDATKQRPQRQRDRGALEDGGGRQQAHHAQASMSAASRIFLFPQFLFHRVSTSRKSGVLFRSHSSRAGWGFLRKGQIYFANLENNASVSSRKAIRRMLSWAQGLFELALPDELPQAEEIGQSRPRRC